MLPPPPPPPMARPVAIIRSTGIVVYSKVYELNEIFKSFFFFQWGDYVDGDNLD